MSVPSAYLRWALDKERNKEHVFFANFVRRFDLFDEDSATRDFGMLLKHSSIRSRRRERIKKAFQDFQDHRRSKFWAERALQLNTEVTIRRAGVVIQDAGFMQAKTACDHFFSGDGGRSPDEELVDDSDGASDSEDSVRLLEVLLKNDDPKRQAQEYDLKRSNHEVEPDEETATDFSQSRSSTWYPEDSPAQQKLPSRLYSPTGYQVLPSIEKHVEDKQDQHALALVLLNQPDIWKVDDVDLLSKFNHFKRQQTQSRFSLALDGIADITPGSAFSRALSVEERASASFVHVESIDERWQSLSAILARVCHQCNSYDEVVEALKKEDTNEPVVEYLRAIVYSYAHYLEFQDEVPRSINEREGFGDLTWPFIRGALKLVKIPSRCFEIPVIGTKERKNIGRDLSVETEEQALMADGVALFGDHQIYLAEVSVIYEPKLDKEAKDKFKMARCLRDSWNSQIRSIAREAMPPTGLTVFGSTSFGDETKFYAMDFVGTYRLKQVGRMFVPLRKAHFPTRMEVCVRTCLRFALDLQNEIKRRAHLPPTEEDLTAACDMIVQTRTTPTKEAKKRRVSGIFTTHQ